MELPSESIRYIICKTMGWDYYTYQAQPVEFLDEIMQHISVDSQDQERKNRPPPGGH